MLNAVEGFRLSSQQKQAWLCQQHGQTSRSQCAVLLEGQLDSERLREALREVVNRHAVLRTTYYRQPGMRLPIQVISESAEVSWSEAELANKGLQNQEDGINDYLRQERYEPFDLDQGPPIRSSLLALSPDRHLWIISLPSLSADYLTLMNVVKETSSFYGSDTTGERDFDEPVQYIQFSEWQNERNESDETKAGEEYWQRQAFDSSKALALPLPRQAEIETGFKPKSLDLRIDAGLSEQIKATAQRLDVTESTFLLACWQILVWRMTGSPDVVIDICLDGRRHSELREAMGLFVTWLPMRSHHESNSTFQQFACQTDEAARDAAQWQDSFTPQANGDENHSAAFPIAFEFLHWPAKYTSAALSFSVCKQFSCAQQFKVKLSCVRREDSLTAELHYNPACYDEANIKRISGHFHKLLASVIGDPDKAISELDILPDAERRRIIEEWNKTDAPYPHERCVHELFEEQVGHTPDSIAVVYQGQEVSYAEVNARANHLAHHLGNLGVGPEVRVGVMIERSTEMIIGLLAILKAGGAYVPLDPAYPADRLGLMVEDARITVLLTQQRFIGKLPPSGCKVVVLDSDPRLIHQHSEINPERAAVPSNLAYILYTSGSTGKPKGVMITHQGVVNYLAWCTKAYAVAEGQGSPVHSPVGFDLTITSLLSPLIVGQRVVLVEEAQGVTALGNLLRAGGGFSLVKLTPSHLEVLSHMLPGDLVERSTKALVLGGEALWGESLAFWRANAAGARIINEYGPTESVVGCCVYELAAEDCLSGRVPIGTPIANMQMYVVDEHLCPVPVGVTGELHIGGVGVARGYANQPGLTAEKFIPDPFSRAGGARLYKTGDLGRYLANGNIEFLGRLDTQVKIRGYRIELGEIEQVLQQHTLVREAIVIARESNNDERHLVAYVVSEPGSVPKPRDLRHYLKERLPEHMLPATWAVLERLPLTLSGKVDLRALPEPEGLSLDLGAGYVPPETELETMIATLWQEALQVEKVGVNDNFLDLGGHSFLLIRINEKLQGLLGNELSVMDMFQYPTISLLAKFLSQHPSQQPSPEHSQLRAESRKSSTRRQREQRVQTRSTSR